MLSRVKIQSPDTLITATHNLYQAGLAVAEALGAAAEALARAERGGKVVRQLAATAVQLMPSNTPSAKPAPQKGGA